VAILVVLAVVALIVVVARNSGSGSAGSGGAPPQNPQVINTGWPNDSPDLNPTGYVPSLSARVQDLKFFEAGDVAQAKGDRVYTSTFRPSDGHFIYWELNLVHPTRQARQTYAIAVYLYSPDGSVKSQSQTSSYIEPDWLNSYCFNRWTDQANSWTAGAYRVSLFVDGVKAAAGTFTIEAVETQIASAPQGNGQSVETAPLPADEPPPNSELPQPSAGPQHELEQNCMAERRLRNGQDLNSPEIVELNRVRGSCEKLYGRDFLPAPRIAPPSASQGWRHFGDQSDTGQPAQPTSSVEQAQLVRRVAPSYPPLAKQARVQGVVKLSATIGTDGKLYNIRVVSGPSLLLGAAIAAVEQWRYIPTRLNGLPVKAPTQIDVNFSLGE
jgi:TonB family protein